MNGRRIPAMCLEVGIRSDESMWLDCRIMAIGAWKWMFLIK